ncbi:MULTISPECIES: hypothetical protein [unclassified Nonomuraea]|uniref:hypothetical protein n=1 Tax=unclassified Nonomuraea TaxID=2593643 RepID=UPI0033CA4439
MRRADPHDPGRLVVDWWHATCHVSRPAGQRVSAADILVRDVPATVTILGTFSTNGMTTDDGDPSSASTCT